MATSNEEWEVSKENIRPIQRGRRPSKLNACLTLHPDDVILKQRDVFEKELRIYSGDDPLSVWHKYIKWIEQNFPKGGKESHLEQLLQRCLSIMKNESKYYDDDRFIDIWLKFANMSLRPIDVYNYMYSNNIGCKSAPFFIAWSWELEQQGNLKKADEVLCEGFNRKVQPLEMLQTKMCEFERRVVNKIHTSSVQETGNTEQSRSAFALLKPQKRNLAPVSRTGDSVVEAPRATMLLGKEQPVPKITSQTKAIPFKIYNSENIAPSLPVKAESSEPFILHSETSKENEKKPAKWNKVKFKPVSKTSGEFKEPTFKLHCDDTAQLPKTPRLVPRVSNVLGIRSEDESPPIALFEQPDSSKVPMYDKNKVYGGAEEYSLEEIRAAAWFEKKQKNELASQETVHVECRKRERELQNKVQNLEEQIKYLFSSVYSQYQQMCDNCKTKSDAHKNEFGVVRHNINCNSSQLDIVSNVKVGKDSEHSTKHFMTVENLPSSKTFVSKSNTNELFSGKSSQSKSYIEAENMVRDLYNGTFTNIADAVLVTDLQESNDGSKLACLDSEPKYSHILQNKISYNEVKFDCGAKNTESKNYKNSLPFTFYHDPTEIISESASINIKNQCSSKSQTAKSEDYGRPFEKDLAIEDVENIPPEGYVQESEKRELAGILKPSVNVFYIPLEEQDAQEESDPEDGCIYNNYHPLQDETLVPPCNTEQFTAATFLSSTPCPGKHNNNASGSEAIVDGTAHSMQHSDPASENRISVNTQCISDVLNKSKLNKMEGKSSIKDQSTLQRFISGRLSTIMETSRDCNSKSSSSNGSPSIMKLSQLDQYSIFHSNNNLSSKIEAAKQPSNLTLNSKPSTGFPDTIPEKGNELPPVTYAIIDDENLDPFDIKLQNKLLESLKLPESFYNNFEISNKLIKSIKVGENIEIGKELYAIENLIGEGAFAKVFEIEKVGMKNFDSNSCTKFALKICKDRNEWELYITTELHNRLEKMNSLPDIRLSVLKIISAVKCTNAIFFVTEFSHQGTLLDFVNFYGSFNTNKIPELVIMYLTMELLYIMSKIHECNIIHGDVKPDNIILIEDAIKIDLLDHIPEKTTFLRFIDFGQAIDLSFFKQDVSFKTVTKYNCTEMMENKPWLFQIDWFGIANCIHVMLFSEYMTVQKKDGKWQIGKKLKRYWDNELWEPLFQELLNIPSCSNQPNVKYFIDKIISKLQQNASSLKMHLARLMCSYTKKK
ncbi:mitotic checkpoint serine/threonine-protein kinase BUB1 beta-like [Stegodyphus dumicola]|uniref:mitotic checkpoint serine/threonine-protein kinase BUB1 beta-like n=1 Tax=Stegodyphus dumicola TaxID=202533 RepID=UPI0015ADE472|nr:mitotic checkpoint serine/threonine-protein kinase BUB1 beta-like [Stegodyphus dumicola]XP_035219293.1 mitotic checkpoint serine/threonine-protein kinase BUB1 beta-like [Stegodyphus dumicola]XP_035219294.1 mitotic checkpoint serine/threonine-protein kinase BUB1 beta-like [Stegodyphus dumicola]